MAKFFYNTLVPTFLLDIWYVTCNFTNTHTQNNQKIDYLGTGIGPISHSQLSTQYPKKNRIETETFICR